MQTDNDTLSCLAVVEEPIGEGTYCEYQRFDADIHALSIYRGQNLEVWKFQHLQLIYRWRRSRGKILGFIRVFNPSPSPSPFMINITKPSFKEKNVLISVQTHFYSNDITRLKTNKSNMYKIYIENLPLFSPTH